jgi:5,6,7,8-tetrahydromethanopterin hydro-lyase
LQLGEAFIGEGPNAAHVNTVLGRRDGPVATAWATALATPTQGHAPFVVVLHPGLPVKPFTLFVNKATIASDTHANLTWGAAQAGVASGVAAAVARNIVLDVDDVLIAAVWVNPNADDADAVFANNQQATIDALRMGQDGLPEPAQTEVWNPFFTPRDRPAAEPR